MKFTYDNNWGDNVLDSRDIIERFEELKSDRESLVEDITSFIEESFNTWNFPEDHDGVSYANLLGEYQSKIEALKDWELENREECIALESIIGQGEGCGDWSYGETLILDGYFTDYIEELVNDCWELPKEFNSNQWPFNHIKMDWDSAADEAKQDYTTIDYGGKEYYMRA